MSEKTELLDCPFCDDLAHVVLDNLVSMECHIECMGCGIEVRSRDCIDSTVKLWNKRFSKPNTTE